MKHLYILPLVLWLAACGSGPEYDQFGGGADIGAGQTPIERALASPDDFIGKPVRLVGQIQSVCKKKGCWMRVGDDQQTVFVRFKDYAFFVPLDAAGRKVVLEGQMSIKTQSVAQVKHYLEDAGKVQEAAKVTQPRKVVSFMATGVAIQKRQ